jgi:hypothetical protein
LIIRGAPPSGSVATPASDSLVLLVLPREAPVIANVPAPRAATPRKRSAEAAVSASPPEPVANDAATAPPQPPKVDWDKEVGLAAQSAIANAAKENAYRNLSALSPDQLAWVRQNQMEPAVPGISWKYRRVEIAEGGFPIIHINDHCVAIPLVVMIMVFCKIGHIEANGKLFEHMRDSHEP